METLEKLNQQIKDRIEKGDIKNSYVAKLVSDGDEKICKKIGEEASEIIISALSESDERLISESADFLFHLMVLFSKRGIDPHLIFKELESRMGISGLDEKAARIAKEKGKF
jgi:phosphoribosyl-ATP pyrophosphohydrolase